MNSLTCRAAELLRKIAEEKALSDALNAELKAAADGFKQTWKWVEVRSTASRRQTM